MSLWKVSRTDSPLLQSQEVLKWLGTAATLNIIKKNFQEFREREV